MFELDATTGRRSDIVNSDVQDRILSAARELFVKNGFNGTSVRDIATCSRTNVAMVNYYYRSKYNLFEIIFEEALDVLTDRIFGIIKSDLPLVELIKTWVDSYYDVMSEYPQIPIFILNEVNLNPERLTKRIIQRDPQSVFAQISERIKIEAQLGNIRQTPPLDFLLNVLSLCIFPFIFAKVAMPIAEKTPEEYHTMVTQHKQYVIEFILNALKPEC